ncbi:antichymotrypsin-2-like isoform X2 [Anticarsia gemmatalis]|uniref:antichymotrypsin-2-like isoform X2 n=1 Tax=Anticarsia gemmatalis TaxID=129554 RepID=UPI003F762E76
MWKLCIAFILFSALEVNSTQQNMDPKIFASAVAKFSAKFCNELDKSKSVVSSPLSAEFVLGLLALGTTEPAHSQLLKTLGIADDNAIRSSFAAVSSKLKAIKGVTLNVANKVYIMEGSYDLHPELKKDAVKVFDAAMEKVDFAAASAAVKNINDWVENKTNKKIKDLLSPDSVNSDTRLVLVNALYFKGSWKEQFNPSHTLDQPFHVNAASTINIPMMYREGDYSIGHSEALNAQLLDIPYLGNEASMLIVLPQEIEGLDGVLKKLADGHDLLSDIDNMHQTKVQVTIPKFKIETEIDLKELLPKLGINAIFDMGNSGLTKILNQPESLYVSKAVQKAFIEVNEEGAEAAAATAMGIVMCSLILDEPPTPTFVADRPFLAFIIVDGAPFFTSTYRGVEE